MTPLQELAYRGHDLIRCGLPSGLLLGIDQLAVGGDLMRAPAARNEGDRRDLFAKGGKQCFRHTGG